MLAATTREETPLTKQMNTLTLWIAGGGRADDGGHVRARAAPRRPVATTLFIERRRARDLGDPEALPTVLQVVLSLGSVELARPKRDREGPAVGRDARVHVGDQLRQDGHADDEPDDRRRGRRPDRPLHDLRHRLRASRARSSTRPASSDTIEDAILPYVVASDAKLVDGKVVGDPTEGALLVLAHKAGLDIEGTRDERPRAGDAAVRPDLQADGDLQPTSTTATAARSCACFVKGAAPAVHRARGDRALGGRERPVGRRPETARRAST